MQDFKKLEVWNDGIEFCAKIYEMTKKFPDEERYGLTSQLRRASASISTNIAEGAGRRTPADFGQFLYMAMGSVKECETLLILAQKLGYLSQEDSGKLSERLDIVAKKLNKFIQSVKA